MSELKKSKSDISDMRNNKNIEFKYVSVNNKLNKAGKGNPATQPSGINLEGHLIVALYVENNVGNQLHESRHGGQIARGEYGFDNLENPTSGYGINAEVSAYRAQYSYSGVLNYIDASNDLNQRLGTAGIIPPISTVTDITQITYELVKNKIGEIHSIKKYGRTIYGLSLIYGGLK